MFARSTSVLISTIIALPALLVSAGNGYPKPIPMSQCNIGNLHCCNSVQTTHQASSLLNELGIAIGGAVSGLVGVTCNPIHVIGIGGNSCSQQPVCCSNNHFNGVVSLGCTPVNLNL
ncbi:hypothetical protein NP233_g7294 [Leucocoprinus birnbaumii]|uniref:Hydrophobin n=1 Tax=Leucocoprinus birnbaumii TaxID=56174 RepID=A0AAD5VS54_9AGAR|nr:hypothetical protein NP233_g7294 [Leucocoprinus birnbaumii]